MEIADFARFGRLHALVLHLPIGLLFAVLVLEIQVLRGKAQRATLAPVLVCAGLTALVSATSGWVLSHEEGYGGDLVERHKRLGIALALATTLAAVLHGDGAKPALRLALYRAALVVALALLVPTGHLGATLTHGEDWLDGPRQRAKPAEPAPVASVSPGDSDAPGTPAAADTLTPEPRPAPDTYATVIGPIFAAYCTNCHGSGKHKGDLRLHTREGLLAGGESGAALVPGDPAASLLLARAELPLEHEDHMPPEGKSQPAPEELLALRAWVAAGAPFEGHVELGVEVAPPRAAEPEPTSEEASAPAGSEGVKSSQVPPEPPTGLLAALTAAFVHHERVAPESPELWVDTAAVALTLDAAAFERLIAPLGPWIGELSLARAPLGDEIMPTLAGFPGLRRLDLRATRVTPAGLAELAGHARLTELVLAQTALDDSAVATLAAGLPALTRVTLWKAGLSAEGLARLCAARPELVVQAGDERAEALESEGELVFTSDRPLPGLAEIPPELRPINPKCPVSDSPVNPKYTLTHEGRVIGFCCPNCPAQFTADPAKFAAKLP